MCDTFIALPPATKDGSVIFAKNSDRPAGEGQGIRVYPGARHAAGEILQCTYIEIPEVKQTQAVLLSRIDWMWGAEMGANECGVVIGNQAVWTRFSPGPPALLGMDLVRLGLERGATARDALDVMVSLLEEFGQGGPCAENDPGFAYDNSFLIADVHEAWVLETAARVWVAERVSRGVRNISNRLSIRSGYDLGCQDLAHEARLLGFPSDGGSVDFPACFSAQPVDPEPGSREAWGALARRVPDSCFGRGNATHAPPEVAAFVAHVAHLRAAVFPLHIPLLGNCSQVIFPTPGVFPLYFLQGPP